METYKKIIETRKNLMSDSNCSFEFPEHEIKDYIENNFIGVLKVKIKKDSTEKLNIEIFNLDTDIDKLELKNLELASHVANSIKYFNSTHKDVIVAQNAILDCGNINTKVNEILITIDSINAFTLI